MSLMSKNYILKTTCKMPKTVKSVKPRKPRVGFSLKKDIHLLRYALLHNPWQLGSGEWKQVAEEMHMSFSQNFTAKSVQKRVDLLVDKYKKEELKVCTGTEEETTERGTLLKDIIDIQENEKAAINAVFNSDTVDEEIELESINLVTFDEQDNVGVGVDIDIMEEEEVVEKSTDPRPTNVANQRKLEKVQADKERDTYVDEAFGPNGKRRGRGRLSLEDEMLLSKQNHDFVLDKEKNEVEKHRLRIEEMREIRLREESERRDALAKSQLDMQSAMMEMMRKFLEK